MRDFFANLTARFRAMPGHIWIALAIAAGTLVVGVMAYRQAQTSPSLVPSGGGIIPNWPGGGGIDPSGSGSSGAGSAGGSSGSGAGSSGAGSSGGVTYNYKPPTFNNLTDYAKSPQTPTHPRSAAERLMAAIPQSKPYVAAGMTLREARARGRADAIDPSFN
jgi:hypothetical protein